MGGLYGYKGLETDRMEKRIWRWAVRSLEEIRSNLRVPGLESGEYDYLVIMD